VSNFGWNHFEAMHTYDASTPLLKRGTLRMPIVEYEHKDGCSVVGGYVYRGTKIQSLAGRYLYGDYCSGNVWSFNVVGGKATTVRFEPANLAGLSSFAQGSDGELYLMSVQSGNFYKLVS
jgi:hypothetical protein